MVALLNGPTIASVQNLVEMELRLYIVIAPILHLNMVGRIVLVLL